MQLRDRIEAFLEARGKTLADLAEYLDISVEDLKTDLSAKSLQLRTLEEISKLLKIPLYDLFLFPPINKEKEIPYYTERLSKEKTPSYKSKELEVEIEFLEKLLTKKKKDLNSIKKR